MAARPDIGYEFYSAQYARFGSKLAAEVRLEAYGEDLGQQGWRSIGEQAKIVDLVSRLKSPHVLDVACGSGGPALAIASKTGCSLTGVDIEASGIATANSLKTSLGIGDRVNFQVADCSQPLPFEAQQFDFISCIDAVLHFKNRSVVFADWFRLLKPGGHLLLTDAAVLTGPILKSEMDIRASQGEFVCVPHGYNEKILKDVGFQLLETVDTTGDAANIAKMLYAARGKRAAALQGEEGESWFASRQNFLEMTRRLSADHRLSRFLHVLQRPI